MRARRLVLTPGVASDSNVSERPMLFLTSSSDKATSAGTTALPAGLAAGASPEVLPVDAMFLSARMTLRGARRRCPLSARRRCPLSARPSRDPSVLRNRRDRNQLRQSAAKILRRKFWRSTATSLGNTEEWNVIPATTKMARHGLCGPIAIIQPQNEKRQKSFATWESLVTLHKLDVFFIGFRTLFRAT